MSIHIDEASQTISLSVRDLCGAEAMGGSLNLSPLSAARNEMGREVHAAYQTTQSAEHESYLKEHSLRHSNAVSATTLLSSMAASMAFTRPMEPPSLKR